MLRLSASDKSMSGWQFRFVVKIRKLTGEVKGCFLDGLWRLGFKFGGFESPLLCLFSVYCCYLTQGPSMLERSILIFEGFKRKSHRKLFDENDFAVSELVEEDVTFLVKRNTHKAQRVNSSRRKSYNCSIWNSAL
jgi:hypothetical protein